nr:protein LAZ1 homolog 2 [Ipomoea batatas]
MAIAAIAHLFVFSAKPYRLLPSPAYGKITTQKTKTKTKTKTSVDVEDKKKAAVVEKTETEVEAPGTSVKKSVQDIVVGGGQQVVEDVVLTINQAIGPVEKGMTKIQEKFHQISVSSDEK